MLAEDRVRRSERGKDSIQSERISYSVFIFALAFLHSRKSASTEHISQESQYQSLFKWRGEEGDILLVLDMRREKIHK